MKTKKLLSYLTMGVLFTGVAFADDKIPRIVMASGDDTLDSNSNVGLPLRVVDERRSLILQTDSAKGGKSGDIKDTTKYVADGLNQPNVKADEVKDKKADDTSKSSEEAVVPFGDTRRKIDVE